MGDTIWGDAPKPVSDVSEVRNVVLDDIVASRPLNNSANKSLLTRRPIPEERAVKRFHIIFSHSRMFVTIDYGALSACAGSFFPF